jgi:flavin reductase (DIM6/NTAB) family NADH-FMN oxidoreductase RutF
VTPDEAVAAMTVIADYPLYVATVSDGEQRRSGCVAGFVTQCSIRPPRYLACISRLNHTFAVAERAATMALHLLGTDQRDMAELFGQETGDHIDKFTRCDWSPGPGGAPILARCAAWTAGSIAAVLPAGDHHAFLVAPTIGGAGPGHGVLTRLGAPDLEPGHPES